MYDGMINVCKEKGFTSHDVVAKLRGILHQKKIGHTGTLDPDATGVLPVCLGKGTKLCDMITDRDKTYRAVMMRAHGRRRQICLQPLQHPRNDWISGYFRTDSY